MRRESVNQGWEGVTRADRLVTMGACLSRRLKRVLSYRSTRSLRWIGNQACLLEIIQECSVVNRMEMTEMTTTSCTTHAKMRALIHGKRTWYNILHSFSMTEKLSAKPLLFFYLRPLSYVANFSHITAMRHMEYYV